MSYIRLSVLGSTLQGEKWSINPCFDPNGEFPGAVDQGALDTAAAAIAALTLGANNLTLISTAMSITGVRLEVRDDATDDLIALSIATRGTPLVGVGSPKMPPQAAVVLSLRTNTPGASGRGRIFWPFMAGAIDASTLRIASTVGTSMLSEFATYFHAVEDALEAAFPLITFHLAVRSSTTHSTPHVVRMQVGNVVDTQRRRRDTLPEAYQSAAYS